LLFLEPYLPELMVKIKVAIIGTAGIPANYGGFETLAEYLVKYLNKKFDFIVYCSSYNYEQKMPSYNQAQLIYIPVKANGKSSIVYDCISLIDSIFRARVLLVLGVGGAFLFPFIRLISRKKIIVNIDGLEWKRQKWNSIAKWYLKGQEKIAVAFAHTVITDNGAIQDYVLETQNKTSQLIAYGGDHAYKMSPSKSAMDRFEFLFSFYAFSVCRIEPENNIHLILKAFANTNKVNLVIVGNWNSSNYGKRIKEQYSGHEKIFLIDAIYDQAQLNELRSNCGLYIHGHSAGGTNPSLVEAMSLGLPVLAFDINYNRYTTENHALYFKDVFELEEIIDKIGADSVDLAVIAMNLKSVADKQYTWLNVTNRYEEVIKIFFDKARVSPSNVVKVKT